MTVETLTDPADGLLAYDVGIWTREKHDYLERYISATREVRARFVPESGHKAGAAFIDLFAGPGRARIRETGEMIDGSPLIAARHEEAPFTRIVCCEQDEEAAAALGERLAADRRVRVFAGDCNERIDEIVAALPRAGLNLALIDPFGATPLRFQTIAKLANLERMDVILHFPTADLERNLRHRERIDRMLGTDSWQSRVKSPDDVHLLADVLRNELQPYGYDNAEVQHTPAIKTGKNRTLYRLLFLTKHPLGNRIWESVLRREGSGQKRLW